MAALCINATQIETNIYKHSSLPINRNRAKYWGGKKINKILRTSKPKLILQRSIDFKHCTKQTRLTASEAMAQNFRIWKPTIGMSIRYSCMLCTKLLHMETDSWHVHPLFPYALHKISAYGNQLLACPSVIPICSANTCSSKQSWVLIWNSHQSLWHIQDEYATDVQKNMTQQRTFV